MSTEEFSWDPFIGMSSGTGPPFKKFVRVGDQIVGRIINVRQVKNAKRKNPNDPEFVPFIDVELKEPEIDEETGEQVTTRTVSIDKVDLQKQVPLLNPQKGDLIAIKFTQAMPLDSGGTLKLFDVRVKKAGEPHIPGAVSAPQTPPPAVEAPAYEPEPF